VSVIDIFPQVKTLILQKYETEVEDRK